MEDVNNYEKIYLPNGLAVEFHDYSRCVVGDRYLVGLLVLIPIKIHKQDFAQRPDGQRLYHDFIRKHGRIIRFEIKKERNFIDKREKDQVFNQLLDQTKRHILSYMGHNSFASGVIRQKILEFEGRQRWWK